TESDIKEKIATQPHSKFLVCEGDIDHIIGYVDSKELLNRVINVESFKTSGEDFAIILNEYAMVMGVITLNDVMTTLMGDLIGPG
ncbi:hypothetical protein KC966_18080, partial [Proteus terrae]